MATPSLESNSPPETKTKRRWNQWNVPALLIVMLALGAIFVTIVRQRMGRDHGNELITKNNGLSESTDFQVIKDGSGAQANNTPARSSVPVTNESEDPLPLELSSLMGPERLDRLGTLDLRHTNINDATLSQLCQLKGLTHIKGLYLDETSVTDAGLAHLAGMTSLRRLKLKQTRVTDAGLEHLEGLSDLESLSLSGAITDEGIEHLKNLSNLKYLDIGNTKVTNAGLRHVAEMKNLQVLYLHGTGIGDEGLAHVKGLPHLQELYLTGATITDDGLEHLAGCTNLQVLSLLYTPVTDAGLVHLYGLTNLKRLEVYVPHQPRADVTQAGVAAFKKALPGCRVTIPTW